MLNSSDNFFVGTASSFIEAKAMIGASLLDAVSFSILAKHGIVSKVGVEDKPQGRKGKPGVIFKVSKNLVTFQGKANAT
jgi:hypothetical protein